MLTTNKQLTLELGDYNAVPVLPGVTIWQGAAVGLNATGHARPLQRGDVFLGFAVERSGEYVRMISYGKMEIRLPHVAAEDLLRSVYMLDDETFTFDAHGNSKVGHVCRYVSPGVCVIEFDLQLPAAPEKKN